jgi:hypothetical protein
MVALSVNVDRDTSGVAETVELVCAKGCEITVERSDAPELPLVAEVMRGFRAKEQAP